MKSVLNAAPSRRNFGTEVYYFEESGAADLMMDTLGTCKAYGTSIDNDEYDLFGFEIARNASSDHCVMYGIEVGDITSLLEEYGDLDIIGDHYSDLSLKITSSAPISSTGSCEYATQFPDIAIYPACTSVIQVADSDSGNSAARTDLVMRTGSGETVARPLGYENSTQNTPFGATNNPESVADSDNYAGVADPTPLILPSCIDEGGVTTTSIYESESSGSCEYTNIYSSVDDAQARSFLNWSNGYAYQDQVDTSEDMSDIVSRIDDIFATAISLFTWATPNSGDIEVGGDPLGEYEEDGTINTTDDEYWNDRETGSPPRVYAIDTTNCYGSYCGEGPEESVTINNQDSGDIATSGSLPVTMKFFAAADKDQLPIRRLIIDWGDENTSGSTSDDNYYKIQGKGARHRNAVQRNAPRALLLAWTKPRISGAGLCT